MTDAEHERMLFKCAEDAYFKACESSDPQHWMESALLAQQHRNALTALNGLSPSSSGCDVRQVDAAREKQLAEAVTVKHAFRAVDKLDWKHLESWIPDSGHGRFWKAVFAEAKEALSRSDGAPPMTEQHEPHTEISGYVASLRQQAQWIREANDPETPGNQRITLEDVDTDEIGGAADALERLEADKNKWFDECGVAYTKAMNAEARLAEAEKTIGTLESNARIQATLLADTGRERDGLRARLAEAECHITNLLCYIDLHQEVCQFDTFEIIAARGFDNPVGSSADTPSSVDKNSAIHKTSSI